MRLSRRSKHDCVRTPTIATPVVNSLDCIDCSGDRSKRARISMRCSMPIRMMRRPCAKRGCSSRARATCARPSVGSSTHSSSRPTMWRHACTSPRCTIIVAPTRPPCGSWTRSNASMAASPTRGCCAASCSAISAAATKRRRRTAARVHSIPRSLRCSPICCSIPAWRRAPPPSPVACPRFRSPMVSPPRRSRRASSAISRWRGTVSGSPSASADTSPRRVVSSSARTRTARIRCSSSTRWPSSIWCRARHVKPVVATRRCSRSARMTLACGVSSGWRITRRVRCRSRPITTVAPCAPTRATPSRSTTSAWRSPISASWRPRAKRCRRPCDSIRRSCAHA